MDKPSTSSYHPTEDSETEPLRALREISAVHSLYAHENRVSQDRVWRWVYLGLLLVAASWGIAAIAKADNRIDKYSVNFFSNSTTCNVNKYTSLNPIVDDDEVYATWTNAFRLSVTIWLPISGAAGLIFSVAYVLLFRRFARAMVLISVVTALLLAYAMAITSLASGNVGAGVILIVVAVLLTAFYWWIRADLFVVAKLLSVAGTGLVDNPWIIPTSIAVKMGGIVMIGYLAFAFLSATYVGKAGRAANVMGVFPGPDGESGYCTDGFGQIVDCCQWNVAGWTGFYCFLDVLAILWTASVVMQVKLYICADVMASWYFMPVAPAGSVTPYERPSVLRAVRHCFVTSFGSLAFAGAILAVVQTLRAVLQKAARNDVICCIINCILQPLLAILEQFTKFATIAVAITGRGFIDASKQMLDTLRRTELPVFSMWWLPDMVLQTTVMLFCLTWAGIVYFAVDEQWDERDDRQGIACAVAVTCFLCVWFQASFIAGVLLDVVNTIYVCYAFDRDVKRVTRPEIHVIYQTIPTIVGPMVENPDGALVYGAPQQQPQYYAQQQQPPGQYSSVSQHDMPPPQQQQPGMSGAGQYPGPPGAAPQDGASQPYTVPMYSYPGPPGQPAPSYQMATSYSHALQPTPGYTYSSAV